MTWQDHAACKGQTELMFPTVPTGHSVLRSPDVRKAHRRLRRLRRPRPSAAEAGRNEPAGVWGGVFRSREAGATRPPKGRVAIVAALSDGRWWDARRLSLAVGRSERACYRLLVDLFVLGEIEVREQPDGRPRLHRLVSA